MIRFITNPALTNLFDQSRFKIKNLSPLIELVIVSDFFPQKSNDIYSGLIEAVKYRLMHPTHYIIILSFHSREELFKHDTFGILSIQGTIFIRLPILPAEIFTAIEKYTNIKLPIPRLEWEMFSTKACTVLLKEKISVLKHASKLDFVNNITGPLRAAAISSSSFPELVPVVKQHLQSVKWYSEKEEIAELFLLANASESIANPFLQSISQFTKGLRRLEKYAAQEELNIKELIAEIDKLNEIASKIQNN